MRFLWAILLLFGAVALFGQVWAEGKHREELSDAEVTDLHRAEAVSRLADDEVNAARERIRKAHGEDEKHSVTLYDGYVVITDLTAEPR